jgi:hypothetical protein
MKKAPTGETQPKDVTICTDSEASLRLVRKYAASPEQLAYCKHRALLDAICEQLSERAACGLRTALLKVKAHSGVRYNEEVDAAAKAVAVGQKDATHVELSDNEPRRKHWWWRHERTKKYVGDLKGQLKKAVVEKTRDGYAGPSVYAAGLAAALPDLDIPSSTRTATAYNHHTRYKNAFKYLYGHLWTARLARRYGRPCVGPNGAPSDGRCPLCGGDDTQGHMLGSCRHPQLHAMHTQRHNTAVQRICEAIHDGENGGCFIFMDACAQADLPDHVHSRTRLPGWLFRDAKIALWRAAHRHCALHQRQPPTSMRDLLDNVPFRPDLLIIPSLPLSATQAAGYEGPSGKKKPEIIIVEVGYTGDARHGLKQHEKADQHGVLASVLRQAGWKVTYTPKECVSLGFAGTIPATLPRLLHRLGATAAVTRTTCRELHDHAVTYLNNIVCSRRRLEREGHTAG